MCKRYKTLIDDIITKLIMTLLVMTIFMTFNTDDIPYNDITYN